MRTSRRPLELQERFEALGYKIYATRSTAKYLQEHGVNALRVNKITQESPNVMDLILGHKIDLVIDTPTQGTGDKTQRRLPDPPKRDRDRRVLYHSDGYGKRTCKKP